MIIGQFLNYSEKYSSKKEKLHEKPMKLNNIIKCNDFLSLLDWHKSPMGFTYI